MAKIRLAIFISAAMLLMTVPGCIEIERTDPLAENDKIENDEIDPEEVEPALAEEDEREFVSVDDRVTVRVERIIIDDDIPEDVDKFLSGDDDSEENDGAQDKGKGRFFVDSKLEYHDEDMQFLALFVSIKKVEEGFINDPRKFDSDTPQLITVEGSVLERTILNFKYTGKLDDDEDHIGAPPGTEGVMVFAFPVEETPRQVHYFYSFIESRDAETEKGLVIIPVDHLPTDNASF